MSPVHPPLLSDRELTIAREQSAGSNTARAAVFAPVTVAGPGGDDVTTWTPLAEGLPCRVSLGASRREVVRADQLVDEGEVVLVFPALLAAVASSHRVIVELPASAGGAVIRVEVVHVPPASTYEMRRAIRCAVLSVLEPASAFPGEAGGGGA